MKRTTEAKQQQHQQTAIVRSGSFEVPELKDVAAIREALIANTGGTGLSASDLERTTFPTGGGTLWSIADPLTGQDIQVPEIIAVIEYYTITRALWPDDFSNKIRQPVCYSKDGQRGIGEYDGVYCYHCEFNKFGSKGKGKKCKEARDVYLLFGNSVLPVVLQVPPTSIKPFHDFLISLGTKGIKHFEALCSFRLVVDKNAEGIKYSKLSMSLVAPLDEKQKVNVWRHRESFITALSKESADVPAPAMIADQAPPFSENDLPF